MGYVYKYIEEIMEGPVMTHQLGSKEMSEVIKEKSRADFTKLCESVEKI